MHHLQGAGGLAEQRPPTRGRYSLQGERLLGGVKVEGRIKALVQGRPVPRVTWFKDGVEIEKKMNMEITDVLGSTSLFVRDATRDHRGVYRVEAKNASGCTKAYQMKVNF